jgi:hypothetical protein
MKGTIAMKRQRPSARIDAILSLLGGALVLFGVFFLPIVHGDGGGSATIPVSEWEVADFFFHYASPPAAVLLALPLLLVLLVLGMSAASLFRALSPGMVTWRRRAAIAGLIIQGLLGFYMSTLYSFALPPHFGAGFALELLGFMLMINPPRPWSKIRWAILISLLFVVVLLLSYWIAVRQGVIVG